MTRELTKAKCKDKIVEYIESIMLPVTYSDVYHRLDLHKSWRSIVKYLEELVNEERIVELRWAVKDINHPEKYVLRSIYLPINSVVSLFNVREGIYGEIPRRPGQ